MNWPIFIGVNQLILLIYIGFKLERIHASLAYGLSKVVDEIKESQGA
jgi:hypothetical protein